MTTKKIPKTKKTSKRNSVKSLIETVGVLEAQVADQTEEIEQKSDKNVRLLAEFDNYKRRTQEERSKLFKYAGEELAKALLPVLDDLQRILDSNGKANERANREGVELIVSKMSKTFEDQGIVAFDSIGQNFDADLHEALMSEKSDKGEDIILREFEKGYNYNDKILRHAKVVVSKS